jgi:Trypsin
MLPLRVFLLILSSVFGVAACQASQSNPPATKSGQPQPAPQEGVEVAPVPMPAGDVEFRAVLDLRQTPGPGDPELRGGREAVSTDWPASLYTTFAARGGTASCTAALIGPTVLLTAAHCVPTVGAVTFTYDRHPRPYAAACARHPDYGVKDPSADVALCAVTPAFAAPQGFQYETVSLEPMSGLIGRTVILTGFGCVSSVATAAPFDGKYRIGFATIDDDSGSAARARGDRFHGQVNNVFTAADPAKRNLCTGDSGGPVFDRSPDWPDVTSRRIVGLVSRVFLDSARTGFSSSIVSATGGPAFRGWAGQWARQTGAAICGIAGAIPNCRS